MGCGASGCSCHDYTLGSCSSDRVGRQWLPATSSIARHELPSLFFFFLNDPAPPEISPLPLPAAFPISLAGGPITTPWGEVEFRPPVAENLAVWTKALGCPQGARSVRDEGGLRIESFGPGRDGARSEEHTSELQSLAYLVCRLLLEKKKK